MSSTLLARAAVDEIVNHYVKISKTETAPIEVPDFAMFYEVTEHPEFNKACLPKVNTKRNFGTGERFYRMSQINGISVKLIEQREDFPVGFFRQSQLQNICNDMGTDGYFDFDTQQRRITQLKLLTALKLSNEECLKLPLVGGNILPVRENLVFETEETKIDENGQVVLPKTEEKPLRNDEFEMVEYYDDDVDDLILRSSYIEKDEHLQDNIINAANVRILNTVRNTADQMQVNFLKVLPTVQRFCNKLLAKRKLAVFVQRLYRNMIRQSELRKSVFKIEKVFMKYKERQSQEREMELARKKSRGKKKGKGKKKSTKTKAGSKMRIKKVRTTSVTKRTKH